MQSRNLDLNEVVTNLSKMLPRIIGEDVRLWLTHRRKVVLLLTDLVMPGSMSGQELARQLLAAQPRLKTIFMSGYSAEIAGQELCSETACARSTP